ncbi:MAG TPA: inositol monophosphatase family protein [Gemmatimonadaceae bacterium]|nr:inositol monophosphatase family protein [Gemmatimonadaceae bacterium]
MQANHDGGSHDQHLIGRALDVAIEAARAAADVIRDAAPGIGTLHWEEKAAADFVTDVDRNAESCIAETVRSVFPDAVIVGEELTPDDVAAPDKLSFIADPLDGTTNFLHGFPHYAVSIGVMHQNALVAGVVVNVPRGDLFTASLGNGTRFNDAIVTVSSIDSTSRSLIGTGFPFKNPELLEAYAKQFVEVSRHTAGIRRAGSAALDFADVACGRFDGFWELTLAPWDVAAGIILIREAGGIVTDTAGRHVLPFQGAYVAGNPSIHPWLLDTVQRAAQS